MISRVRLNVPTLILLATASFLSFLMGVTFQAYQSNQFLRQKAGSGKFPYYKSPPEGKYLVPVDINVTQNAAGKNVEETFLFFNRIHKTGSENFVLMMELLQKRNKFQHIRCRSCYPDAKRIPRPRQRAQTKYFADKKRPMSFDRHVYFFDFEEFDVTNPLWFTLVRDPIRKFESKFYYSRNTPDGHMYRKITNKGYEWIRKLTKEEWRRLKISDCVLNKKPECDLTLGVAHDDLILDLSIPYFCGQDEECLTLGSEWAFKTAKENVEKWYPVVGILEDLNATIVMLEATFPRFFEGFTESYTNEWHSKHHSHVPVADALPIVIIAANYCDGLKRNHGLTYERLSPQARDVVAANFSLEIEFYEYLKQRLETQIQHLQ